VENVKKYIKQEIKFLEEQKIKKRYSIPPEIKDALENQLEMYPLIRFIKSLKAINSIPPSYRIFILNGQFFDIIYEDYSLKVKIENKEYYLGDMDERNYAKKHLNRLLTKPIIKTGEEEIEGGDTAPAPPTPTPEPEA